MSWNMQRGELHVPVSASVIVSRLRSREAFWRENGRESLEAGEEVSGIQTIDRSAFSAHVSPHCTLSQSCLDKGAFPLD
jgi:hypothetical protein